MVVPLKLLEKLKTAEILYGNSIQKRHARNKDKMGFAKAIILIKTS